MLNENSTIREILTNINYWSKVNPAMESALSLSRAGITDAEFWKYTNNGELLSQIPNPFVNKVYNYLRDIRYGIKLI